MGGASSPERSDEPRIKKTYHDKNEEKIEKLKLNHKTTNKAKFFDPQSGEIRHERMSTIKLHLKYREDGVWKRRKRRSLLRIRQTRSAVKSRRA